MISIFTSSSPPSNIQECPVRDVPILEASMVATYTRPSTTSKIPIDFESIYQRLSNLRRSLPSSISAPFSGVDIGGSSDPSSWSPTSFGVMLLTFLPLAFSLLLLMLVTRGGGDAEEKDEKKQQRSKFSELAMQYEVSSYFRTCTLYDDEGNLIGVMDVPMTKYGRRKAKKGGKKRRRKGKIMEIFPTIAEVEEEEAEDSVVESCSSSSSASRSTSTSSRLPTCSSFECLASYFFSRKEEGQRFPQLDPYERGARMQKFRPRRRACSFVQEESESLWERVRVWMLLVVRLPLWVTMGRGG